MNVPQRAMAQTCSVSGNSSQVSDGAAAVLIGRRSAVEALGLPVLGVLRASAVVGVPPDVMGVGPAVAIPAALEQAGKSKDGGRTLLIQVPPAPPPGQTLATSVLPSVVSIPV